MVDIAGTLKERGRTHGFYYGQATLAKMLKRHMHGALMWKNLAPDQEESLDMIAVKISRILSGNCNEPDHWADIAGYAKLVADRLEGEQEKVNVLAKVPEAKDYKLQDWTPKYPEWPGQ